METRISGGDVALDPTPGDDENNFSPIAYLTEADDEPALIMEREQTAANRSSGLHDAIAKLDDRSRRIIESRWLREEDHGDAAGARRRVRRFGGADSPDRKQGHQDDARADGARRVTHLSHPLNAG